VVLPLVLLIAAQLLGGDRNTSMVYDAAGRMTLRTDPLNHTVSNSYDSLGILTSSVINAEVSETHSFDGGGHLASRATANG
jgi:YD repeat-containing protein